MMSLPPEFGFFIPALPPGISFDYNNFLTWYADYWGSGADSVCRAVAAISDVLRCLRRRFLFGWYRWHTGNLLIIKKYGINNFSNRTATNPLGPLWHNYAGRGFAFGMTWMEKPQMFNFHQPQTVAVADQLHYIPYVPSPEDQPARRYSRQYQRRPANYRRRWHSPFGGYGRSFGASTQGVPIFPGRYKN